MYVFLVDNIRPVADLAIGMGKQTPPPPRPCSEHLASPGRKLVNLLKLAKLVNWQPGVPFTLSCPPPTLNKT